MRVEDAITSVKNYECYAMVFQPRASNTFDRRNAKFILRVIGTPGGNKVAYHELTDGYTGSGIYDEPFIANVFHKTYVRYASAGYEPIPMDQFDWVPLTKDELPTNLHIA